MRRVGRPSPAPLDLAAVMQRVSDAATPFESRWTLRALRRVDRDLHDRLLEQQGLYHEALVTGDPAAVEEHAAAMCRGWAMVTRVMEAAAVEDDAYLLGHDPKTGTTVAVGENRHAIDRVRALHGQRVVWLTPDEIAALFAGIERFKTIAAIKQQFPAAEIIDVHPKEPAKGDR